jgi:hypothetical protein
VFFLKQGLGVEVWDMPWRAKWSDHSICLCSICSHLGILGRWTLAPLWSGMFTKKFQTKRMSTNQLSKTTLNICGKHLWH